MRSKWIIISFAIVGIAILGGILAPVFYPLSDEEIRIERYTVVAIHSPGADSAFMVEATPPSPQHPLGTNHVGMDILALILWGVRPTLIIASTAMLIIIIIGTILGTISGYMGGKVDTVITGFCNIIQPFNNLAMYMFLLMMLSHRLVTIIVILSMTNWVPVARVVRGEVLKLREIEFVNAAISVGGEEVYIAVRHIVPNLIPVTLSLATDTFSETMLLTSSLSFLGVNYFTNLSPIDLGQLVAAGYRFLTLYWWESILPGIALILIILASNVIGMELENKIK